MAIAIVGTRADGADPVFAGPLAHAGEKLAAVVAHGALVAADCRAEELRPAPPGHPVHRLGAVFLGLHGAQRWLCACNWASGGGSDGGKEEARAHAGVESLLERHC